MVAACKPRKQEGAQSCSIITLGAQGMAIAMLYDLYDYREEQRWNKHLANMMTYSYVCCDSMPNRTCEAYDNLIARKNFFAVPSGQGVALAKSWKLWRVEPTSCYGIKKLPPKRESRFYTFGITALL